MLNNLAVKYVHLTVVQMLYVYLTIVYGKNDEAHVRSMPKRSLFWQLGRHDHLGFIILTKASGSNCFVDSGPQFIYKAHTRTRSKHVSGAHN